MRRVPSFLPPSIKVWIMTKDGMLGNGGAGTQGQVMMDFVLFGAPALIHGLLMTEVPGESRFNEPEIVRFFFGYKCSQCQEIYLIPHHIRTEDDLYHFLRHTCDACEIRRAVINARRMAEIEEDWDWRKHHIRGRSYDDSHVFPLVTTHRQIFTMPNSAIAPGNEILPISKERDPIIFEKTYLYAGQDE